MAESTDSTQQTVMSGWLFKWTNILRGYQKRWFVLSNGYLSYYRNQDEGDHSYRGSIYIHGATVHSEEPNTFSIISSEESYHIKTSNETEKHTWIAALELVKQDQSKIVSDVSLSGLTGRLRGKLQDLHACQKILEYHDRALQSSLSAIEVSSTLETIVPKIQEVNERAAEFRASTSALINACSEYLDLAQCQADKWIRLHQTGKQKRVWSVNVVALMRRLTLNKHEVSKDASSTANERSKVSSNSTDVDPGPSCSGVKKSTLLMYPAFAGRGKNKQAKTTDLGNTDPPDEDSKQTADTSVKIFEEGKSKGVKSQRKKQESAKSNPICPELVERRSRIPNRPPCSMSLWNVVKNSVGKDLSRVPIPLHFSEPLSFLQRITESFEYAHLILDKASDLKDPAEQIAHVAGFAISSYSTTPYRTSKPFNPLLGETYECDRISDFGWKSIAEQVSHNPPTAAIHCEGKQWTCWLDQTMTMKFQGQNIFFIPSGDIHLKFNCGNHYVWNKVTSTLHNLIIGKMWIDQEGDMDIKCFTNGFSCKVSFKSPGYFGGEPHKVKGSVYDKEGLTMLHLSGSYVSKVELVRISSRDHHSKHGSSCGEVIWSSHALANGSDKYYNFSTFACQLNEMESGIAPTDSRYRPDQRFMENGQVEEAEKKKLELEDRQRSARKGEEENHAPVWFQKQKCPFTQKEMYVYNGEYWSSKESQNWSRCPIIF
ncbi:hypothetical protein GE061_012712 [Apolygus lucorum]|uniref:PH domain-containing protein n=1 Tax=Apolygus lucorum TaxID=248454 RepID=A0A8S9XV60_APOLU|nr:hypothetical protein GE061_012712 [Apolygus lucorum]